MSIKNSIKASMIWNVSGLAAEMLSGFLVMPLLIHRLGDASYGVWVVVGSMTSYFGLLDLGVRGSIGRFVALYSSQGDAKQINQTVCSGVLLLIAAAGLISLSAVILTPLFFRFFEVPPSNHDMVVTTIRIVILQLCVFLVGTAFDAVLWGLQRFDATNMVDIPAAIFRLSATSALIWNENDLPKVAMITLGMSFFVLVSKAILCFRCCSTLELKLKFLNRSSLRQLLGFGSWNLLASLARVTRRQFPPLLIGSILGLSALAPFSIADRILTAVLFLLSALTGVLTPYSTNLHAKGETLQQKTLFLRGGYYNAAVAGVLVVFLSVFAGPLINVWVGSSYENATAILVILLMGEFLGLTQFITGGILQATARHRITAIGSVFESILVFVLANVLIARYGIIGAAYAVAFPAFLFRGAVQILQGCVVTDTSVVDYFSKSLLIPVSVTVAFGGCTWLIMNSFFESDRILTVVFAVLYFIFCGLAFWLLERLPWKNNLGLST